MVTIFFMFQPFSDMCKEVLHVIERDGEPDRDTSILIDTPAPGQPNSTQNSSQTEAGTPGPGGEPGLPSKEDGGQWCCSVS